VRRRQFVHIVSFAVRGPASVKRIPYRKRCLLRCSHRRRHRRSLAVFRRWRSGSGRWGNSVSRLAFSLVSSGVSAGCAGAGGCLSATGRLAAHPCCMHSLPSALHATWPARPHGFGFLRCARRHSLFQLLCRFGQLVGHFPQKLRRAFLRHRRHSSSRYFRRRVISSSVSARILRICP